jgi:hypothetical protein
MPAKKKEVDPTALSLSQRLDVLFLSGRTIEDIQRVSTYCNLEREFKSWRKTLTLQTMKE